MLELNTEKEGFMAYRANHEIILKISNNKATGHDGISVRVIKEILPAFVSRLCDILNLSITTNVFPEKWKIAQVNDIYNYRPIPSYRLFQKSLKNMSQTRFLCFCVII